MDILNAEGEATPTGRTLVRVPVPGTVTHGIGGDGATYYVAPSARTVGMPRGHAAQPQQQHCRV